ncbi:hypothetical protein CLV73_3004 [Chryseobacterium geocarposphaerae]|uniref:Uncharacterized protein n=2 Tax=Chryseobacterium geocarposphaerae TaxID=1416776 RepID=A0A2M9C2H2_9FLAO|nr:hypothetical protein CLV73_3004 [Chryseobacterium geocarposphaerae]
MIKNQVKLFNLYCIKTKKIINMKNLKALSRKQQKAISGGVQGPCTNYCVPKPLYTATCVKGWCVYSPVGPE